MTRRSSEWLPVLGALAVLATSGLAMGQSPLLRRSKEMVAAFNDVVAGPANSTVRVVADGKDAALGAVVSPDGYIVTKASLLKGKLACKLKDGRSLEARLLGLEPKHDLALLKIDATETSLTPIEWAPSKAAEVGDWVAAPSTGATAAAVGVVSVATRKPHPFEFLREPPPPGSGFLGVFLKDGGGNPTIGQLEPGGPAAAAGLKMGDSVLTVEGRKIPTTEKLISVIKGFKAGVTVTLLVMRGGEEKEIKVKLGSRPPDRTWVQNTMGSELSKRRDVPILLQHDTPIKPGDCGGPLVNLDGKAVGLNIARGGRTESYALPSEAVVALIADLKAGKHPLPKGPTAEEIAKMEDDVDLAQVALAAVEKALEKARGEEEPDAARIKKLRADLKAKQKKVNELQAKLDAAKGDPTKK